MKPIDLVRDLDVRVYHDQIGPKKQSEADPTAAHAAKGQDVPFLYSPELGVEPFIDPQYVTKPEDWLFESERAMVAHYAENLELIEPGLHLPLAETVEFPCSLGCRGRGGRIDILALDRDGNYAVVECKQQTATAATLGQVLSYVGWIQIDREPALPLVDATGFAYQMTTLTVPPNPTPVRAFIVCKRVAHTLWLALAKVPELDLTVLTYSRADSLTRALPPTEQPPPAASED